MSDIDKESMKVPLFYIRVQILYSKRTAAAVVKFVRSTALKRSNKGSIYLTETLSFYALAPIRF